MAIGEFALIERYFRHCGASRADVVLGVGDDGAILRPPPGFDLVAVSDTLVEGVHFPLNSPPRSIGHRSLAVNLSDIAAMGATAAWSLLALTLPQTEESWLADFAAGYAALARQHDVALVGGDTTRGPLAINVQVLGFVPAGRGLRRSGAQAGDLLCVSGTPGDAAAGLRLLQGLSASGDSVRVLTARFEYPTPRLALGRELSSLASACIDISDGLLGDIGKMAVASGCGALIDLDALPRSSALATLVRAEELSEREALGFVLGGGDDYELAFAVPRARESELEALRARHEFTIIGELTPAPANDETARVKLQSIDAARTALAVSCAAASAAGFDHFGA